MRDVGDVKALIGSKAAQIVDARAAARFEGTVPEPRQGLRSGHIPGSRNVPFASLLNADGTLKPAAELRAIFAKAGVDPGKPVVASCGSGVTAGVIALALAHARPPRRRRLRRLLDRMGRRPRPADRDRAGAVVPSSSIFMEFL